MALTAPDSKRRLRVAIIGAGPGGLGAAIALSSLPDIVDVSVFEQAQELREIGAGIRIGYNCWRVLELLGAADGVKGHLKTRVVHRNGLNGQIVKTTSPPTHIPDRYYPQRVRRTRLQSALVSKVPEGVIHLKKRLASLHDLQDEGVKLVFEDGTETQADLVVGADGIRSVVRQTVFPDHGIKFTGTTIWRVLIPAQSISQIPDMTPDTSWWHGPAGHVYGSLVDDHSEITAADKQMFEISCRHVINPDNDTEQRFSWGVPATKERVEAHFENFDPRVRQALSLVPNDDTSHWKEFNAFAGPELKKLIAWNNKVVLIGDASHPLSGAFGSGAAFALEDGWILSRAIAHATSSSASLPTPIPNSNPLSIALPIFDEIRSPYYLRMYDLLSTQKLAADRAKRDNPSQTFEDVLKGRVETFGQGEDVAWIYENDIERVWEEWVKKESREKEG